MGRTSNKWLMTFWFVVGISANAAAGHWQNNLSIGGFNQVHIYTPDTLSPIGDGRSLMILLHGCTQSIDSYLSSNLEIAADEYGMVIAVPDAINKAGFGCWSYWQGTRSRTAGDYRNLITLANTLSGEAGYNIDKEQVYIAGLSSGASFANTTACIAPDIFAGMGISAGPSIGTSASGAISTCEGANVAQRCRSYAGSYSDHFDTQLASIAHGDIDTTVNTCYNRQNADGMAGVYEVNAMPAVTTIEQNGREAEQLLWQDNRVSMLWLTGVNHAWSGGQGASGAYISGAGINYALYLAEFFAQNNLRVNRNLPPEVRLTSVVQSNNVISVSGDATDSDGSVVLVEIRISDDVGNQITLNVDQFPTDQFSISSPALPDGLYTVDAVATDELGGQSSMVSSVIRLGPTPAEVPPVLANVSATTLGSVTTVTGGVTDANGNLESVVVDFATGTQVAEIEGNQFIARLSDLPGPEQLVVVTATDSENNSASVELTIRIDSSASGTLQQHIATGLLDYTNYANCYLEYADNVFSLWEFALGGGACQWQDGDASCVGPVQACADSEPDDDGDNCQQVTAINYFHKQAERAYSTGNQFAPDYFAFGSNDALVGSTYGNSTLHSFNGVEWYLGECL